MSVRAMDLRLENSIFNISSRIDFDGTENPNNTFVRGEEENFMELDGDSVQIALTSVLVFLLAPLILIGNLLVVLAIRRFKKLQTPSNYYIVSLACADMGIGFYLPSGLYFETRKAGFSGPPFLCLLPYSFIITLCSVSVLSMAGIAVDRARSLAMPLHYRTSLTHKMVGRHVAGFWIYALLLGSLPILWYYLDSSVEQSTRAMESHRCSFHLISPFVFICIFSLMFGPCQIIMILCYIYIWVVARYHANAIYSMERHVRKKGTETRTGRVCRTQGSSGKYGTTLAMTVGIFLLLWLPIQVLAIMDACAGYRFLEGWSRISLGLLALTNSALNPWVYGYNNMEINFALKRLLGRFFYKLGIRLCVDYERRLSEMHLSYLATHGLRSHEPNLQVIRPQMEDSDQDDSSSWPKQEMV